jgi:hypothetical protein
VLKPRIKKKRKKEAKVYWVVVKRENNIQMM